MELPKKVRLIRCSTNDNEAAEFDSLDRTNAKMTEGCPDECEKQKR